MAVKVPEVGAWGGEGRGDEEPPFIHIQTITHTSPTIRTKHGAGEGREGGGGDKNKPSSRLGPENDADCPNSYGK